MDMLPKLGAIVCYGTGYDGVDLAAAAKRNIAVGHSPGANAASVADIAVTLMLAVDAALAGRPTIMCAAATGRRQNRRR